LARADPHRSSATLLQIRAVDMPTQAEVGVIGDRNALIHVVVGEDTQDRAEDLFLGDPHRTAHFGEDRRLRIEASLATTRMTRAAAQQLRAFGNACLDHRLHARELRCVRDWP